MSYRAFWQRRCRAVAAGAVLEPLGGNCAAAPYTGLGEQACPRSRSARRGRGHPGCRGTVPPAGSGAGRPAAGVFLRGPAGGSGLDPPAPSRPQDADFLLAEEDGAAVGFALVDLRRVGRRRSAACCPTATPGWRTWWSAKAHRRPGHRRRTCWPPPSAGRGTGGWNT